MIQSNFGDGYLWIFFAILWVITIMLLYRKTRQCAELRKELNQKEVLNGDIKDT